MKKILFLLLIVMFAASMVYAEDEVAEDNAYFEDSPFAPMQAEVLGVGGSFVSDSRSYNAMFGNPAGYAKKPRSLTLLSVNPWVYARPDQVLDVVLADDFDVETDALGLVMDQVVSNGIGAGASFGVGWVGGLALGVLGYVDSYVYGKSQLGIQGEAEATVSGLVGLGLPIRFSDNFALLLGGNLRTLYRVKAPLPNAEVLAIITELAAPADEPMEEDMYGMEDEEDPMMAVLNQLNIMFGYGIAIDLGAMLELGPFTAGLSIRDFANTKVYYDATSVANFIDAYETEGVPVPEDTGLIGQIPMDVSAGVSFHPDLGWFKYILDPRVYADFTDVLGYFGETDASMYTHLHAGVEAKVLSLVRARAGFNQGYLTAGVGVKLLFAEVHASIFTEELGSYVGERPRSGASVEVALRF